MAGTTGLSMRKLAMIIGVAFLATGGGCGSSKAPSGKSASDKPDNPSLGVSLLDDKTLQFKHAGPQGADLVKVPRGFVGHATSIESPAYNVVVNIAWPSPKTCEMSMDYDSKGSRRKLTVTLTGFSDAKATRDGKAATLPVELPSGKHLLVVTANCP